jgi:hypothetical protein
MSLFLVYLFSFIGTSIIDALWRVFFLPHVSWVSGIFSDFLMVAATMLIVLYKTQGRPKILESVIMGATCGILAISVNGLMNVHIFEFIWGPIIGAFTGLCIALLAKKFLKY